MSIIRQAAFENQGTFLKGCLHVHTKRSDGIVSPEDTLKLYEQKGYDFVALTDHRRYNAENHGENSLTILPGVEFDWSYEDVRGGKGIHRIDVLSLGPADGNGFVHDQRFPYQPAPLVKEQEEVQPTIDSCHANNNLTVLCHPTWSATPVSEFERLKGHCAIEVTNMAMAHLHDMDVDNGAMWDYLLIHGQRIFGVATDDAHDASLMGLGWVRVNCENHANAIIEALREGRFYASTGPEIYDFYVEDGVAHVKCSSVTMIKFQYGRLPSRVIRSGYTLLTAAEYKLPEYFTYIRATIIDAQGNRAWTNPIFLS